MRKILPILLVLTLFCGCATDDLPEDVPSTDSHQSQTVNMEIHVPDSQIEQQTTGAIRQYALAEGNIDWIVPLENGILLVTVEQDTTLTVLSNKEGTVTNIAKIPIKLTRDGAYRAITGGFSYYHPENKKVVYLDLQLNEIKQVTLPESITGNPVIASDGNTIYYCVGQELYALDVNLNITRPIRTNTGRNQVLLGCYLNNSVLACSVQDAQEQWSTVYISTETGQTLSLDRNVVEIKSKGNGYFVNRKDGTVTQHIFGEGDATPKQLNVSETDVTEALALGGAVGYTAVNDTLGMSFYHLETGKKTATIYLEKFSKPVTFAADENAAGVWIFTEDKSLFFWELNLSAVNDEKAYDGGIFTKNNPDVDGLAECQNRADTIAKEHGIVIRTWEKALMSNGKFDIQPEYQTTAIHRALDELETQLKKFPSKFLYKSVPGRIRVCIVRSIGGEITSAYHWYDGDPFIILSVGVNVEQAFVDAFSYVLDIHILGNSPMVDNWASLNPAEFVYGEVNPQYLQGENRAFTDEIAMKSVVDDRARIFYHAMLADNGEIFKSEIMQTKLKRLCEAIRDAWRWEQKPDIYPWEQYLKESTAYIE